MNNLRYDVERQIRASGALKKNELALAINRIDDTHNDPYNGMCGCMIDVVGDCVNQDHHIGCTIAPEDFICVEQSSGLHAYRPRGEEWQLAYDQETSILTLHNRNGGIDTLDKYYCPDFENVIDLIERMRATPDDPEHKAPDPGP